MYRTRRGQSEGRAGGVRDVPRRPGERGVDLEMSPGGPLACFVTPWPFSASEVRLPVRARRIADRTYADDEDLGRALADAPWVTLAYRVRPAPGGVDRPDPEPALSRPGT